MNKLLNQEQHEFLINNVSDKNSSELTKLINKEFSLNLTISQIQRYKKHHKIKSGLDTRFKVGHRPSNKQKIGAEFTSTNGYVYVKVKQPNKWIKKGRYVYEQAHGKIPKGYCIMHGDGNKENCDLSNLILVENKDKLTAKNMHLLSSNYEVTKTGLLTAKLINTVSQRKRSING